MLRVPDVIIASRSIRDVAFGRRSAALLPRGQVVCFALSRFRNCLCYGREVSVSCWVFEIVFSD
jgi:hypothetical protein